MAPAARRRDGHNGDGQRANGGGRGRCRPAATGCGRGRHKGRVHGQARTAEADVRHIVQRTVRTARAPAHRCDCHIGRRVADHSRHRKCLRHGVCDAGQADPKLTGNSIAWMRPSTVQNFGTTARIDTSWRARLRAGSRYGRHRAEGKSRQKDCPHDHAPSTSLDGTHARRRCTDRATLGQWVRDTQATRG